MKEFSNEDLVDIIRSPSSSDSQRKAAENVLFEASGKIGLKAIRYDTRKGDIPRENVLAEIKAEILERDLINKFTRINPETGESQTWSTYVGNQISFEAPNIYERAKQAEFQGPRIDAGTKQIADPTTIDFDKPVDTKQKRKINVLKGFTGVNESDITNIVKVKKGDTYKQISEYTGEVGNAIFDIPAAKIVEGDKNLTYEDVIVTEDAGDAQFELFLDTSGSKKVSFSGIVTSADMGAAIGDLEVLTVNFTANGAITFAI